MFRNAYSDGNSVDKDMIKQDFDDLYEVMHGKILREKTGSYMPFAVSAETVKDRGFTGGIGLGFRLAQEVKTP